MKSRPLPRWTVSFADLALLLLAFFLLLHAGSARDVAAAARGAFSSTPAAGPLLDRPAASLFEPGEARLTLSARAQLRGIGRRAAASGGALVVESLGRDPDARRFDAWELAAARAAAVARALSDGGLKREDVRIVLPGGSETDKQQGQRLLVRSRG